MTVQPAAARWTVSSRLGFIPNTHWQLGRTIDVPLGGTISRYASTGFYSGILHVLASALVTYFTAINCDFKQHFRTGLHVTGAERESDSEIKPYVRVAARGRVWSLESLGRVSQWSEINSLKHTSTQRTHTVPC